MTVTHRDVLETRELMASYARMIQSAAHAALPIDIETIKSHCHRINQLSEVAATLYGERVSYDFIRGPSAEIFNGPHGRTDI